MIDWIRMAPSLIFAIGTEIALCMASYDRWGSKGLFTALAGIAVMWTTGGIVLWKSGAL